MNIGNKLFCILTFVCAFMPNFANAEANPNPPGDAMSSAFDVVNDALKTFVDGFSTAIANDIAPLVYGGLVLSFIGVGILAIRGMLDKPLTEVAWRMVKASVIIAIALTTAGFQSYISDIFLTMPDDLIASTLPAALPSAGASVSNGTGSSAVAAIEALWELGLHNALRYWELADLNPFGSFDPLPLLYGLLVLLGTLLCVVVGALWIFIAKVVLALMLGVAPIFIVCLIWQPTQQYFWNWFGMVLNTVVTVVLVIAVFSIFSYIFDSQLNALVISDTSANLAEAASFTFLGVICMGVLVVIPGFVTQLTSAAGGAVSSGAARIVKGAASGGASLASGAMGTARAGAAAPGAAKAYRNARNGNVAGNSGGRMASANHARHEFNKSRQEMKQGYPDYFRRQKEPGGSKIQGAGNYAGGGNIKGSNININSNFKPKK